MGEGKPASEPGSGAASGAVGALPHDPIEPFPTLRRLVGDTAAFRREHWGHRPLRHRVDEADPELRDVLLLADVDRWLAADARLPSLRMVRAGTPVPVPDYTRTVRIGGRDVEVADPLRVAALVGRGATLVVQNLDRSFPRVRAVTERLREEISHPVQANAYLTPPEAAGLARHADAHDVLVLQLHGTKRWDVEGLGTFEVAPGDVVYVPRGTPHTAATTEAGPSLHLTVGILSVTARDALRRALDHLAASLPALDAPLPLGFAGCAGRVEVEHMLAAQLRAAAEALGAGDATELAAREVERAAEATADRRRGAGALAAVVGAADVAPDTALVAAWPLEVAAAEGDDRGERVELRWRTGRLVFPAAARAALHLVTAGGTWTPSELPGLDEPSRLVVARRLLREGVLRHG